MSTIIHGKHSLLEALYANIPVEVIYIIDNYHERDLILKEIDKFNQNHTITIKTVNRKDFERITGPGKVQGVAAEVNFPQSVELSELLRTRRSLTDTPFYVLLDHLEDPQNVGAILRSAECAGVQGIVIPKVRSAGMTGTVVKTSAGAVFHLPVAEVSNIAQSIERMKKEDIWIVGTHQEGETFYYDVDFTLPVAIVIGAEGEGMKQLVKNKCDFVVKIPLLGKIKSLNAASAASIIFFEVVRQRNLKRKNTK